MGAGRDLWAQCKDGRELPIEVGLNSVRTSAGNMVVASVVDITARKRAEEHKELLIGELHHRTLNLFSVIHSVAAQSLTGDQTLAEGRESFIKRLLALARAYTMLTDKTWSGALLSEIVALELSGFSDQVELVGAPVIVRPSTAQGFALLFHELATNAAKYGALLTPDGRISARWRVNKTSQPASFSLDWEERGGPRVVAPARKGYGQRILEQVGRQFGTYDIHYAPEGFKYHLDAPLERIGLLAENG
jgi:two-component sensor histidine kinase